MLNSAQLTVLSHSKTFLVLGILFLGLLPTCVFAGPPYLTDDPEPVDFRHWEFYIASMYQNGRSPAFWTGPHFELNYGAAPNLQLHLIAPTAWSQVMGGPTTIGYGDTELGVKYRFVQETSRQPMVGIFPLVELPTGAASRNLGAGQTQFYLPVWIQKSYGNWQSYGGGGYWRNPGSGNRDYWFFGAQTQNQVTKKCSIGGELYYTSESVVGQGSHTGFNVGSVYDFDEGHHLMFSVGRDLHGSTKATGYLAYQWTFGPKDKSEPGKDTTGDHVGQK